MFSSICFSMPTISGLSGTYEEDATDRVHVRFDDVVNVVDYEHDGYDAANVARPVSDRRLMGRGAPVFLQENAHCKECEGLYLPADSETTIPCGFPSVRDRRDLKRGS